MTCRFCLRRPAFVNGRCVECHGYLRWLDNGSDADRAYRQQLVDRATEYTLARGRGRGYQARAA